MTRTRKILSKRSLTLTGVEFRSEAVLLLIGIIVLVGVLWRSVWLTAGLADTTWQADIVRSRVLPATQEELDLPDPVQWLVTFPSEIADQDSGKIPADYELLSVSGWDSDQPVWVVAGDDGKPGWINWDDNGDGVVDDMKELGAAWSDDFCLVSRELPDGQIGRIIDRGGFVEVDWPERGIFGAKTPIQVAIKISDEP